MFTGLIQEVGRLQGRRPRAGGVELVVQAKLASQVAIGDSVAVEGACQTATRIQGDRITVFAMAETLARTTLGALKSGCPVNLELALRPSDRMGGHWVQGHVDGLATIRGLEVHDESVRVEFQLVPALARYVVPQGSITLSGVSLTVVGQEGDRAWVSVIPHTWDATTLRHLSVGAPINVEVDVLAKYVERLVAPSGDASKGRADKPGGISSDTLRRAGY